MEAGGQTHLFGPRLLHKRRLTLIYRHHISCAFADSKRNHAITTNVIDICRHFNHASHQKHVFIFVVFITAITYNSTSDKSKEKEISI